MKQYLLFCCILSSFSVKAQSIETFVPSKPAYARLYNDENAFAYYHSKWRKLEDKLIDHQKKTGNQIVLVTIATTGGYPISDIAITTFRKWGIGERETNSGLLVLIARKEKQISIETGYGLEGEVTDMAAASIINTILQPGLDSFNFILSPQHAKQGYLPAIERAIDTLVTLTKEPNFKAINNTNLKVASRHKNRYKIILMAATAFVLLVLIIKRRKFKVPANDEIQNSSTPQPAKSKTRRTKRTARGQYWYPLLFLLAMLTYTILWPLKWFYFIIAAVIIVLRWIYYLPSPKLNKETIAFNKEWEANQKKMKQAYREKKKILGNEKSYKDFDAYMAKYFELGLDKLEKELKLGVFAPKPGQTKNEYDVKSLLYDIFLGTTQAEKKRSFSSNNTPGYSGDATGGQSATDYGGGSTGGGGASS